MATDRLYAHAFAGGVFAYAPEADCDDTRGFRVGHVWLDSTNGQRWICTDATTGAAVWEQQVGGRTVGLAISAAGTVIGDATALTKDVNVVSTVGSGAGVKLPNAAIGEEVLVVNAGANALLVYPHSGSGTLGAASAGTAVSLAVGNDEAVAFLRTSSTAWQVLSARPAQSALIADPTGGATTDTEARAAIASIIDALQAAKIVALA